MGGKGELRAQHGYTLQDSICLSCSSLLSTHEHPLFRLLRGSQRGRTQTSGVLRWSGPDRGPLQPPGRPPRRPRTRRTKPNAPRWPRRRRKAPRGAGSRNQPAWSMRRLRVPLPLRRRPLAMLAHSECLNVIVCVCVCVCAVSYTHLTLPTMYCV